MNRLFALKDVTPHEVMVSLFKTHLKRASERLGVPQANITLSYETSLNGMSRWGLSTNHWEPIPEIVQRAFREHEHLDIRYHNVEKVFKGSMPKECLDKALEFWAMQGHRINTGVIVFREPPREPPKEASVPPSRKRRKKGKS